MVEKHILVPVDFSNDSIRALEYAILLANQLSYNIRLIHVKRRNADYDPSFNFRDFDEVLKSGIKGNFETLIKNYLSQVKGSIDYRIREGRIYTEICNQATYGDASFIVMGTHGVSGFEERWVGSNAFRIVNHACCPVVTIRYNFPMRPISKIVLPIDASIESRRKVPFIVELAQIFNAELHVIDVRDNNRQATKKRLHEYTSQVKQYLERRKIKTVYDSLKGKKISDICIEYALIIDADLIAIMNDKPEKTHLLWVGHNAQQMVNHSPIPIISFHQQ